MIDGAPQIGESLHILVFQEGRSALAKVAPIAAFGVVGIFAAFDRSLESAGAAVGCLLMAFLFSLIASRRWIAEFDLQTRTLNISRRSLGRWTKTIVDCPLDQCRMLGRIEYETDGQLSYGVYVELVDGTRHTIPLKTPTLQEAGKVAAELSEATGIPRLDTRY
jgi:hypothetical protein